MLDEIFQFRNSTSKIISFHLRSNRNFGPKERDLATNIIFEILRFKTYFESKINKKKSEINKLSQYRLLVLLGSLSILRDRDKLICLNEQEKIFLFDIRLESIEEIYSRYCKHSSLYEKLSVPKWIYIDWLRQRKESEIIDLIVSNSKKPSIYCRGNILKHKLSEVKKEIKRNNFVFESNEYLPACLKFPPNTNISKILSSLSSGDLEVQDFGSQLIAKLVNPSRNAIVADFCAGTGGKTLALGVEMKNSGKIFALDIIPSKIMKLKHRVNLSNLKNVWPIVISGLFDKRLQSLKNKVDYVLVDAPCLGFGTLRRNPDLKWKYSEIDLNIKIRLQQSILQKASELCKVGGHLIYATCTNIYSENQGNIENFLNSNPSFERCNNKAVLEKQKIFLDDYFEIYDSNGNIQLWTDLTDSDCFFMTKMMRKF